MIWKLMSVIKDGLKCLLFLFLQPCLIISALQYYLSSISILGQVAESSLWGFPEPILLS
jgi:hypothetical protein